MIEDWREKWKVKFPFYYVQIAPFRYQKNPEHQVSQKLRDAQRKTLKLPNTGMAVTLDIGNFDNIHPSNKQEVGFRLARLALKKQYNLKNTSSGPTIKGVELIDRKLKIKFDDVGDGLIILDKNSEEFEIADSNMNYLTAKINVLDDYIIVYSEDLTYPKYVRYGWSDTPNSILFNSEGLPVSSFSISTDD